MFPDELDVDRMFDVLEGRAVGRGSGKTLVTLLRMLSYVQDTHDYNVVYVTDHQQAALAAMYRFTRELAAQGYDVYCPNRDMAIITHDNGAEQILRFISPFRCSDRCRGLKIDGLFFDITYQTEGKYFQQLDELEQLYFLQTGGYAEIYR